MKTKLFTLLFIVFPFVLNAQDYLKSHETIVNSEKQYAEKTINSTKNMNTGNYDLKYHRLEFNVDPNVAFIKGDISSYFEAKENLDEIIFELSDKMIVSEVLQRGSSLSFTQNSNNEVVITLPVTQNEGVLDSLTISYYGNPVDPDLTYFNQSEHDGDPIIWTLSEPYGALEWWPCKQDLNDKIDEIDVYITTPQFNPSNEEYFAVANGLEQSQIVDGINKTTHFKHQYPIPAYLIAIAVTNYEIYSHVVDNNGNPFDIINYVFPEDLSYAKANTPITVDIINLFANLFEEYPYSDEKYGHAQWGWEGGGMEHTTVSFMGDFNMNLIAHELAHQWFGNKITCGSWQDVWINEGFATYLTGLTIKNLVGENDYKPWRNSLISNITSETDGSVYVPAQDTTDVGRVFSGRLSYYKPAMVLHMLNNKLGEATFLQGLQAYLSDPNFAFGYAKTPDFHAKMEEVSGEDLTEFFNDWIYGEGYPIYTIEWSPKNITQIDIVVNQEQSHSSVSFFEALVPLRIFGTSGEQIDIVLDNTVNEQEYVVDIGFEISSIAYDYDRHVISRFSSVVLGLSENSIANNIKVYPNPTTGILTIQSDFTIVQIEIYNQLGQLVLSNSDKNTIDVSELSQGLYFCKIKDENGNFGTKKIVKE